MTENNRPQDFDDDEINLIDLIYPIYKKRRFLITFSLVIAVITAVVTFFQPKTYQATAVILPVSGDSSSLSGLESSLLGQTGVISQGASISSTSSTFEAVLKSNELAAKVLNRYDYFSIKGIKKTSGSVTSSCKELTGSLTVTSSKKDPTISISIKSQDPVFASDIANSYVKELDDYNLTKSFTTAGRLREYLEKRTDEAGKELDQAQSDLREFQEKSKAVSISQQGEATLKVLGEMEAKTGVSEING